MSFRRFVIAITVALALAFSTTVAADTANACDPMANGGYC
jgi:hypothetical protein